LPKPLNALIVGAAAIIVVVVVVLAILLLMPSIRRAAEGAQPPNVSVTSKSSRTGINGLDYVAWVDVSVHNYGGEGNSTVWVRVTQGTNKWTKSKTFYYNAGESKDLTFEFSEIGLWTTNPIYYLVWVE